jgi:hypothetical protein
MSKISQEADFIECPNEPECPWFQVPRSFARDNSLSLEARGLLTYLMSHKQGFNISIPWVIKTQKLSKNKIYRIINECIQSGYLHREIFFESGKKRFKYLVSKTARFKNILLCPQKQDTEKQDPENEDAKLEQSSSSYREEEKGKAIYEEGPKSKSSPPKPASAPPQVSADADALCTFFFEKIKERNPEFKEPKLEKWKAEFDCLLRIDKRDPAKVKKLIEWASTHKWWKVACLSPGKLRKEYDQMMAQMMGDSENEQVKKNRLYAMKLKEQYPDQMKALSFDDKFAIHRSAAKEIPFSLPEETFKRALIEMFGGTYVRRD